MTMKHKISGLIVYVFYCFFFSVSQRKKRKKKQHYECTPVCLFIFILSLQHSLFFFASLRVYVYQKRIIMAIKEKCVSV